MDILPQRNSIVAVYDSHTETEAAIRRLLQSKFDMTKLSVAAKDLHGSETIGYYMTGDRMKYWGRLWTFWDILWGLLSGWAFFTIPEIGPVLVAGPLAGWIVLGLENAAVFGGLDPLAAGLYNIGVPKDSLFRYESALNTGKFLVVAHGATDEVNRARRALVTEDGTPPAISSKFTDASRETRCD